MSWARVLVTRPEPSAARTARTLLQRGFAPLVLPLTQTRALAADPPDQSFDLTAITSANAVRHASPALIASLHDVPVVAVGSRTAEMARAAGFRDVEEAGGTAEAMAVHLLARTTPATRIAYLCGSPRKPLLEQRLRQAGRPVDAVETYATVRLALHPTERVALESGFDAALVYSAESALALVDVLVGVEGANWRKAAFVCLSADVARALPDALRIMIAATPDETSLLASLENLF